MSRIFVKSEKWFNIDINVVAGEFTTWGGADVELYVEDEGPMLLPAGLEMAATLAPIREQKSSRRHQCHGAAALSPI
jgi:hypothetical protein